MATYQVIIAVLFTLALAARVELSSCYVLKGSVSCLDCDSHYHLSEIMVQVQCSQVKKLARATTAEDGSFQTELPMDTPTSTSLNCLARILGGPTQLYIPRKDMISSIVKSRESESYVISKPLNFYRSCPMIHKDGKCDISSSKTVDLPVPGEWGLPPTSYYTPFIPIIGIP